MSLRERANRPRGVVPTPHEIRLIAFVAVGWAVVAAVGAVYFALVLGPAIGYAMDLHLASKRGSLDLHVDTAVLATVSYWVAGAAIVGAVAAIVTARRATQTSYALGVIVCFAVPLYLGVVLPNGWITLASPGRDNAGLLFGAGLTGFVGLIIGGLSFTFGPVIIDGLANNARLRRRTPQYRSPLGRDEA